MKPTPGPWTIGENHRVYGQDPSSPGEEYLVASCDVYAIIETGVIDPERWDANARLIAAAPELLETCREAIKVINNHTTEPIPVGVCNRITRLLSDAIAKTERE